MSADTARKSACATPGSLRLLGPGFAGEPDLGVFELLLDLGYVGMILVARRAGLIFLQRTLPLSDGFADLAFVEVDVAQVIVDGRVARHGLQRLAQFFFSLGELVLAI